MNDKLKSVLIGALLAGAGAIGGVVIDAATAGAFGPYSAVVGAIVSVALNAARKALEPAAAAVLAIVLLTAGTAPAQCPGGVCPIPRSAPAVAPVVATDGVALPGIVVGPAAPRPVVIPQPMARPATLPTWVPVEAPRAKPVRRGWFFRR